MSREFGDYHMGGFFHQKIQNAADDLKGARCEISKQYIPLLEELYQIAWAISSAEECDSGEDRPIFESINRLPRLKAIISDIEDYVEPYKRVAAVAVRDHVDSLKASSKNPSEWERKIDK